MFLIGDSISDVKGIAPLNPVLFLIFKVLLKCRVATNLENMENLENSGNLKNCQNVRGNSGKFKLL